MLEITMHFAISIALKGLSQFYNSTGSQGIYAVFKGLHRMSKVNKRELEKEKLKQNNAVPVLSLLPFKCCRYGPNAITMN